MANWILKALAQGILSRCPQKHHWNDLLHSGSVKLTGQQFKLKLNESRKHLENYFSSTSAHFKQLFRVLEIGTGFFPILPVAFYLCGSSKIFTVDRACLMSLKRLKEVLAFFTKYAEADHLTEFLPWVQKVRASKLRQFKEGMERSSVSQVLEGLNIYPMVCDARDTGLPSSSIDFFVSNTTLEYIPEHLLSGIFTEFRRLASPGAMMSHLVITSDHYADIDHSITPFNFLKFPRWAWRLFNNTLHYQNRLRLSDYRRIHHAAGFDVVETHNDFGSPMDLQKIRVSKDFRHYSRDDLLVIRSRIVSTLRAAYSEDRC